MKDTLPATTTNQPDVTPPTLSRWQEGEPRDKRVDGDWFGWDTRDAVWRRINPKWHPGINPFDNYTIAFPLKAETTRKGGNRWVDANGVCVTKDGRAISRACYPSNWQVLKSRLWKPGEKPTRAFGDKRLERAKAVMKQVAAEVGALRKYVDSSGNVKPELIVGFYSALMELIFRQPEVQAAFVARVYEQAIADPLQAMKYFRDMMGPAAAIQLTVGPGGTAQGQAGFVKLNIFERGTETEEPTPGITTVEGGT